MFKASTSHGQQELVEDQEDGGSKSGSFFSCYSISQIAWHYSCKARGFYGHCSTSYWQSWNFLNYFFIVTSYFLCSIVGSWSSRDHENGYLGPPGVWGWLECIWFERHIYVDIDDWSANESVVAVSINGFICYQFEHC